MKREFFLIFIVAIFSVYLISSHTTAPASFSVNPNSSYQYNITISNSDTGPDANVTQVNITLPASFNFISESNGTSTIPENFIEDSNVLSWTNESNYLIQESGSQNFWFNANASNIGEYNLTITVVNLTGNFEYNISVTIADTQSPSISFGSSTPSNNAVLNQTSILLVASATDNIATDTITGYIYNSSRDLLASSITTNGLLSINFTNLTDGDYYINATVNDTSGNTDSTSTRKITLNTSIISTTCTESWNCTAWSSCTSNLQIRSCVDSNACNDSFLTKNENQTCGATCTSDWNCTDWEPEECGSEGTQTKTCTDLNGCSSPEETVRDCEKTGGSKFWIITIFLIIVLGLFLVGIIFFLKGRSSEEPPLPGGKIPPSGPSTPINNYSRRPPMPPRRPQIPRRPMMRRPAIRKSSPRRGNLPQNKPL